MSEEVRRRAACDRCHSQKVRCPRRAGETDCDRCSKAGSPCIFSPFRQKKPRDNEPEPDATPYRPSLIMDVADEDVGRHKRKRTTQALDADDQSVWRSQDLNLVGVSDNPIPLGLDQPFHLSSQQEIDPIGLDWPNSYPTYQDGLANATFDDLQFGHTDVYLPRVSTESPLRAREAATVPDQAQLRRQTNLDRSLQASADVILASENVRYHTPEHNHENNAGYLNITALDQSPGSDCIRELSQLSIDLFRHKATIPALTSIFPDPNAIPAPYVHTTHSPYLLEDTFRLTQNLIELYPKFLEAFLSHASQSSTPNSDWLHTSNFGESGECSSGSVGESSVGISAPPQRPPLDHSAILFFVSCHLQVINVYELLFKHMELCILQKGVAITPEQISVSVPTLAIGNYVPPRSAAVPMQMLLLIQFASQLSYYAADLATEVQIPSDDAEDYALILTKAAAQNVKDRASKMSAQIRDMRASMLNAGLLA